MHTQTAKTIKSSQGSTSVKCSQWWRRDVRCSLTKATLLIYVGTTEKTQVMSSVGQNVHIAPSWPLFAQLVFFCALFQETFCAFAPFVPCVCMQRWWRPQPRKVSLCQLSEMRKRPGPTSVKPQLCSVKLWNKTPDGFAVARAKMKRRPLLTKSKSSRGVKSLQGVDFCRWDEVAANKQIIIIKKHYVLRLLLLAGILLYDLAAVKIRCQRWTMLLTWNITQVESLSLRRLEGLGVVYTYLFYWRPSLGWMFGASLVNGHNVRVWWLASVPFRSIGVSKPVEEWRRGHIRPKSFHQLCRTLGVLWSQTVTPYPDTSHLYHRFCASIINCIFILTFHH